ncbi:hypothetical protein ABW21_db0209477 [Orbilia brochopaga]|nr:hypothetical protein ABW21_db0209477 [Drechslerella brochopaga]
MYTSSAGPALPLSGAEGGASGRCNRRANDVWELMQTFRHTCMHASWERRHCCCIMMGLKISEGPSTVLTAHPDTCLYSRRCRQAAGRRSGPSAVRKEASVGKGKHRGISFETSPSNPISGPLASR